jgi:hypothetical protein
MTEPNLQMKYPFNDEFKGSNKVQIQHQHRQLRQGKKKCSRLMKIGKNVSTQKGIILFCRHRHGTLKGFCQFLTTNFLTLFPFSATNESNFCSWLLDRPCPMGVPGGDCMDGVPIGV